MTEERRLVVDEATLWCSVSCGFKISDVRAVRITYLVEVRERIIPLRAVRNNQTLKDVK